MRREQKRRRSLTVTPIFEPDRIAQINLQAAYEKVVSPHACRIIAPKPPVRKVVKDGASRRK